MNKYIKTIFLLLIFSTTLTAQEVGWGVSWTPPFLPFSINYGDDGWSIKAEKSFNTPVGKFGIEVSGGVKDEGNNSVRIIEKQVPGPVQIRYVYRDNPNQQPIIKIKEVEKIVTKTITKVVEKRSYILELKNYKGSLSQEFIIQGLDVFSIEAEGLTKIEAREGRIIIDLSGSMVKEIKFRGGLLSPETDEDRIPKLCAEYNIKYIKSNGANYVYGFVLKNQFDDKNTKINIPSNKYNIKKSGSSYSSSSAFDYSNDLIDYYKLTDPGTTPIVYYKHILITNKGICFNMSGRNTLRQRKNNLYQRIIKKKPKFEDYYAMIGVSEFPKIYTWDEFLSLRFEPIEVGKIKVGYRYDESSKFTFNLSDKNEKQGRERFDETQFIRFLIELQELINVQK